jgi:crossover junction endodeoxyribonuclease RuvC
MDASDAVAVAMCHHFQIRRIVSAKKQKDWKSFITVNPGRVKTL